MSPALEQASLLFSDLGWQTSGPLTGAAGASAAPSWMTALDAAGTPQMLSTAPVSTAPSWMTALDAAGTPQVPASLQSTLGGNVDLRL
jgi:hypothetical protein